MNLGQGSNEHKKLWARLQYLKRVVIPKSGTKPIHCIKEINEFGVLLHILFSKII